MAESVQVARLIASFEASSKKYENSIRKIENDTRRTAALLKQHLGGSNLFSGLEGGLAKSARAADATLSRLRSSLLASSTAGVSAMSALRRAFALVGVAISAREIVQAADSWQMYANKLAGAGVPAEKVNEQLNGLVAVALRTRTGLEPVVDLYSKLTLAAEQYGLSASQATRVTETVAKAAKAGGASPAEQSSTILQLSQAIGSGVLQGDELRSLRENAPLLVKALAKELGTTTGQMKKLGEEGKLTGDVILRALLRASTEIDAAFGKTIPTVSEGFTNLTTSFTALVGEFDKGAGLTRKMAEALAGTAVSLDNLRAGAQGWGASLAQQAEAAFEKVKPLYDLLSALGRFSPLGIAVNLVGGSASELERGKAMLKRGLGTPLTQDVDAVYRLSGEEGEIKKPPVNTKKIDDEIKSVERRTEALRAETSVVGASTIEAERARTVHELLAAAKAAEIPVSDELRAKIEATANAYAFEADRLEQARLRHEQFAEAQREAKSAATEFVSGYAKDLANGVSKTEALTNALTRLRDRLIDLAANKSIDAIFNLVTKSLPSLLGNFPGSPTNYAGYNTTGVPGSFDSGGVVGMASYGPRTRLGGPIPTFDSGGGSRHYLALLEHGERVTTALMSGRNDRLIANAVNLAQRKSAGVVVQPQVNIVNNHAGASVTAQPGQNGGIDVYVDMLDRALADRAARGRGALAKVSGGGWKGRG